MIVKPTLRSEYQGTTEGAILRIDRQQPIIPDYDFVPLIPANIVNPYFSIVGIWKLNHHPSITIIKAISRPDEFNPVSRPVNGNPAVNISKVRVEKIPIKAEDEPEGSTPESISSNSQIIRLIRPIAR